MFSSLLLLKIATRNRKKIYYANSKISMHLESAGNKIPFRTVKQLCERNWLHITQLPIVVYASSSSVNNENMANRSIQ